MEKIYFFCPSDQAAYLHLLDTVSASLDDAGVSFHICRPEEDIPTLICKDREVKL